MSQARHTANRGGPKARARALSVVLLAAMLVSLVLVLGGCSDRLGDARALDEKGDPEGAMAIYREIVAGSPEDLEALNGLAIDLLLLGRYDEALPVQERIVALDSEDVLTRVELAFNCLNHQEEPARAVEYLEQAVALEASAKYLTFLAQAQIEAGDAAGAEDSLGRALVTDGTYPHARQVLVALLEDQGRSEEAAECRRKAADAGVKVE